MKTYGEVLIRLSQRYGISNVFNDFLNMIVCALSMGAREEEYLKIVGRYEKHEVFQLSEAFSYLVNEMDNDGEGLKDCLGEFFMEHLSFGKNGQFFTPEPICEMMARITNPQGIGERILDCACGSGRTLLAAAKVSRMNSFYGADIDRTCCLMAVVNLCMNGMCGEVAWMDSLANRYFGGWAIELHPVHLNPYVREITEEESYIMLRIPEAKKEMNEVQVPEVVREFKQEQVKEEVKQASLWDDWQF
jgi:type I restriction-modification system DNA methylase subunit